MRVSCGAFYAHPQNRFRRVLAALFGEDPPRTIEEKTALVPGREAIQLPSTSPADAQRSMERLTEEWKKALLPYLE